MSRFRDHRGSALVETPFAVIMIMLLGFGLVTVVQLTWTHLDLASSVRSAARYASRVEYDPGSGTGERRRTEAQVIDGWRERVAEEVGVALSDVTITVGPDPADLVPGDEVVVRVETRVTNALYGLAAGVANGFASLVGGDEPFDEDGMTVAAEAVTYVE